MVRNKLIGIAINSNIIKNNTNSNIQNTGTADVFFEKYQNISINLNGRTYPRDLSRIPSRSISYL